MFSSTTTLTTDMNDITTFCDLPSLCLDLVCRHLCEHHKGVGDVVSCARQAAQLAMVGNPIFTEFSDKLYDSVTDVGCYSEKYEALSTLISNQSVWLNILNTRDIDDDLLPNFQDPMCSLSISALRDMCRLNSLSTIGGKSALFERLREDWTFKRDRKAFIEHLFREYGGYHGDYEGKFGNDGVTRWLRVFSSKCPVRQSAREYVQIVDEEQRSMMSITVPFKTVKNVIGCGICGSTARRRFMLPYANEVVRSNSNAPPSPHEGRMHRVFFITDLYILKRELRKRQETRELWKGVDAVNDWSMERVRAQKSAKTQAAKIRFEMIRSNNVDSLLSRLEITRDDLCSSLGGAVSLTNYISKRNRSSDMWDYLKTFAEIISHRKKRKMIADQMLREMDVPATKAGSFRYHCLTKSVPYVAHVSFGGQDHIEALRVYAREFSFLHGIVTSSHHLRTKRTDWTKTSPLVVSNCLLRWTFRNTLHLHESRSGVSSPTMDNGDHHDDEPSFLYQQGVPFSLIERYLPAVCIGFAAACARLRHPLFFEGWLESTLPPSDFITECSGIHDVILREIYRTSIDDFVQLVRQARTRGGTEFMRKIMRNSVFYNICDDHRSSILMTDVLERVVPVCTDRIIFRRSQNNATCTKIDKISKKDDEPARGIFHEVCQNIAYHLFHQSKKNDPHHLETTFNNIERSHCLGARQCNIAEQRLHRMKSSRLCTVCCDLNIYYPDLSSLQRHVSDCHKAMTPLTLV